MVPLRFCLRHFLVPTLASSCLIDRDLYERRHAELTGAADNGTDSDGGNADDSGSTGADAGANTGTDSGTVDADLDGDGYGLDDCDDADALVFPGADETWLDDGVDNDCDGDTRDPLTWSAGDAATRLLGAAAGDEFGRRIGWWAAGECLLVSSTFAETNAGAVYAFEAGAAGDLSAADAGKWIGADSYTYLANAIASRADGITMLAAPSGNDGAGAIWLADAAVPCAGSSDSIVSAATLTINGAAAGDYLGSNGRWLPDLDGDGVDELAAVASSAAGGGAGRGAIYLFFDLPLVGGQISVADADLITSGGHDGAALSDVQAAWGRDDPDQPALLFAQNGTDAGGHAVVKVRTEDLRSGVVDDMAQGSIISYSSDRPTLEVVGDLSHDGHDELIAGVWTYGIWGLDDLEGVVEETAASTTIAWDSKTDWITGFTAIGDADGDNVADFMVLGEDWPDSAEQGALAVVSGADLTPDTSTDFTSFRLQATGSSSADSFAYRAQPVGDFDRDGVDDLAVSTYGSDVAGTNAGAVVLMPIPL
jgi:Putative metal-binding motif